MTNVHMKGEKSNPSPSHPLFLVDEKSCERSIASSFGKRGPTTSAGWRWISTRISISYALLIYFVFRSWTHFQNGLSFQCHCHCSSVWAVPSSAAWMRERFRTNEPTGSLPTRAGNTIGSGEGFWETIAVEGSGDFALGSRWRLDADRCDRDKFIPYSIGLVYPGCVFRPDRGWWIGGRLWVEGPNGGRICVLRFCLLWCYTGGYMIEWKRRFTSASRKRKPKP